MKNDGTQQRTHRGVSKWVRWTPNGDIVLALATELWMVGAYYAVTHWASSDLAAIAVFYIPTNLIVNVLLPVWWIAYHRKQPLSELGITTRRWLLSLLISVGLAAFFSFRLVQVAAGIDWLPHVIGNAVILWEPFFIHGWLQLRFDRAFGIVPGVLLAGLCLAGYHVGTYPLEGVIALLFFGLIYATTFRLTSNLLIMWPLTWCVGSSLGTLMGDAQLTWNQVAIWSVVLLIQLIFIGYTWWRQNRGWRRRTPG
jgi:hypothetical protein